MEYALSIKQWEGGTIYFPGELVKPRTGAANSITPIVNPDFELGDSDWTKGTGWTIDQVGAWIGTWSAAYSAAAAGESIVNDTFVPVIPGQSVTAKAFCDRGADILGESQGAVQIRFYDVAFSQLHSHTGTANRTGADGQWVEINATWIAPADSVYAKIAAWAYTTTGIVRIDNFSWDLASTGSTPAPGLIFKSTQAESGLSGSEEPTWPTVVGNTVVDNEVTWEAVEATTVTWEAGPILLSGSSEPTWPTIPGATVSDGTISWECVRLHIEDENCPHTREVAIGASKVFAGDDDITRFCATLNPRDWTTSEDAGFIPSGQHQGEEVGVSALGVYRGNLAIWSPSSFQVWQIDPDPAAMALLDAMEAIGSFHHKAVQAVSNDLFFLSSLGVRTVGIAAASTNLATGDAGIPIDPLIQAELDGSVDPLATFYPSMGQYWLAFPPYTESEPSPEQPEEPPEPEIPTYEPKGREGYTYTQNEYLGDPDFAHPFEGDSYDELTMSSVFTCTVPPITAENGTLFSIAGPSSGSANTSFAVRRRPVSFQLYFSWGIGSWDNPVIATDIANGTHEITIDHGGWLYNHWYWMAVSYNSVTGDLHSVIRNLSLGEEKIETARTNLINQLPVKWEHNQAGKAASICTWGTGPNEINQTQFLGVITQEIIHNKYIDLSVEENRNKFCCLTGIKDLGAAGVNVFGEIPLVYIEDGFPENNLGTKFIGNPSDFYATFNEPRLDTIPPLCPDYVPPPSSPPEMALPYWDNLDKGWIDISAITNTTFEATFGAPIEDVNFEAVFAIGGELTPVASLVNTLDGGNQLSFIDDASMTEAIMLLVSASGVVLDYVYYQNVASTDFITVPTGEDYYIVTASDTGNAKINKTDITDEHELPDLTGTVTWDSFFGLPFGSPYVNVFNIIPAAGVAIAFTVPITTDDVQMSILTIDTNGIPTRRFGSISQNVLDFNADPKFIWGLGGGIKGLINNGTYTGSDPTIQLVPGQTYILNLKNETPSPSNWIRTQVNYVVQ